MSEVKFVPRSVIDEYDSREDLEEAFRSDANKIFLIKELFFMSKEQGHVKDAELEKFALEVLKDIKKYDLPEYQVAYQNIMPTGNAVESLHHANKAFIKTYRDKYAAWYKDEEHPQGRDTDVIQTNMAYITPEGYRTLDLYDDPHVSRDNSKKYRYKNSRPFWQHTPRHMDRDVTEGLRDTRDLEVFQRGYDMTRVLDNPPFPSSCTQCDDPTNNNYPFL